MRTFPFRGQREGQPEGLAPTSPTAPPAEPTGPPPSAPAEPVTLLSDESLVEVRCSVVVMRGQEVLLLRRQGPTTEPDWVLPGGRPRAGEGMQACAGRELAEETGVRLTPQRCAFVTDVTDPLSRRRRVEILFAARVPTDFDDPLIGEGTTLATWVDVNEVRRLRLRPPVAGYLPALVGDRAPTIPYLGNMWRPDETPA